MNSGRERELQLDKKLQWMLDAPFYIDAAQLDSFYDAVIQPKSNRKETLKLEITQEKTEELSSNLNISVDPLSMFGSLSTVLSPIEAGIGGGAKKSRLKGRQQTHSIELTPIDTPQRQLIQLTSQYLVNKSKRIFFVDNIKRDTYWEENIDAVPRELVFLNLPSQAEAERLGVPETKLIPMAAEFSEGRIETLYDKLDPKRKDSSWRPYIKNFTPDEAIETIEEATEEKGTIEWINYRLPLDNERTARIHFEPRGKYNNGTFAYNLIRMGHKHGLRLIGTVYAEPDIRVLAGYRK